MNRRRFGVGLFSALVLPQGAALADDEPFPIFASDAQQVEYRFRKRTVAYDTAETPGTIIVDSRQRFLYFVLGQAHAIRYGVGVGREEFGWSGEAVIGRKAKWPSWSPRPEQKARSKVSASWAQGMPGGLGNPLGARALYLYQGGRDTYYRIHGTDSPATIGHKSSTGCIRMLNMDVADLYDRVAVGTRVVVLPGAKMGLF
ncbi:L,D-transpeptidase [Aestuariivirga sp.]|uniref:L,D-transpeptidase n=1 Tax=Aestuariivirga sp. TaxID=2650926 RepID=UPI0039E2C64C